MNDDAIAALIRLIQTDGFIAVTCQTDQDPMVVEIDLPAGLSVTLPYTTYEQIRADADLPDDVCDQ